MCIKFEQNRSKTVEEVNYIKSTPYRANRLSKITTFKGLLFHPNFQLTSSELQMHIFIMLTKCMQGVKTNDSLETAGEIDYTNALHYHVKAA